MTPQLKHVTRFHDFYSVQWVDSDDEFNVTRSICIPEQKVWLTAKTLQTHTDTAEWLLRQENLEHTIKTYLYHKYAKPNEVHISLN